MKRIFVACLILLTLLYFAGCGAVPTDNSGGGSANHKQDSLVLTDEQAVANAKMLNEEYNLNMDKIFNLSYGGSKVKADGYNRYIVQLVYQYENSNRQQSKSDSLFYFTYDPADSKTVFDRFCFWDTYNFGIGNKDGWDYLKSKEDFYWGIDPATLTSANDENDNFQDSNENAGHSKTLFDYTGKEKHIDENVGDTVTVTGAITQNSGTFPTWCMELEPAVCFQEADGNGNAVYFDCDKLFFYDTDNLDGIPFSAWESETVTVNGTLENYRSGGNLFLHRPTLVP